VKIAINLLTIFISLIAFAQIVIADTSNLTNLLLNISKINLVIYAAIVLAIIFFISTLLRDKMGEIAKIGTFIFIAIIVAGVTGIMVSSIVYSNLISVTGGPVHWHAKIDFTLCGVEYDLPLRDIAVDKPLHTHADQLIHVETTPITYDDVRLHKFFEYIGGEFTNISLTIPTDSGLVSVKNGDLCQGEPGQLKMFVNGQLEPEMDDYIISPLEAGNIDEILIVFEAG
jgi:ABC-type transport system involved in multi-copper enzyme maturation permease subunit